MENILIYCYYQSFTDVWKINIIYPLVFKSGIIVDSR